MATYVATQPFVRAQPPTLAGSDRKWIENELKKIELTLKTIQAVLEELKARVPY